jgi:hypothetical protein
MDLVGDALPGDDPPLMTISLEEDDDRDRPTGGEVAA